MKKLLPKRIKDTHKGDYGQVFILAGSEGMLGASILCSRAALRVGAGIVYLGTPSRSRDAVNMATPEVIVIGGDRARHFKDILDKTKVIAIGPGLGWRKKIGKELLFELARRKYPHPVVLDADGLMAFVKDTIRLSRLGLNLILTPHPGEMAKLLDLSVKEVLDHRQQVAREASQRFKSIVILKGHKTLIADPKGKVAVNETGNPGLATAGSGDILTGMIAGLAAQGYPAREAAVFGVYLHGLAGDLAARRLGEYSLIASDLLEQVPQAMQKVARC